MGVLSACNTIASDKRGVEALSGLACSFFYAGAPTLLVCIGRSVRKPRRGLQLPRSIVSKPIQKIGRSEALRQAMFGYLNDKSSPRNAYPAFWGPFARIAKATPVEVSIVHSSKISERDAVSRGPANGACYAPQQTFLQHIWPVCRINQNSRDRLGKPGVHHY
jgi:hypothetical protein